MSRHELVPCAFLALPAMTRSHLTLGWNVIASEVGVFPSGETGALPTSTRRRFCFNLCKKRSKNTFPIPY
jgi:hypothetical protein